MGSTDTCTLKVNNPGSDLAQWQRRQERELLFLITGRTLGVNGTHFLR